MKKVLILVFILCASLVYPTPILHNVSYFLNKGSLKINYSLINKENINLVVCGYNKKTKECFDCKDFTKTDSTVTVNKKNLPKNINFDDFVVLLKAVKNGKIYYEMQKIESGSYTINDKNSRIQTRKVEEFYISKFEVTNEQFESFVMNDGYEIEDHWIIEKGIMPSTEIGWKYIAKYKTSLPYGWNFADKPMYKKAKSNFKYSAVTNVNWFESYAFCKFMTTSLPNKKQLWAAFSIERNEGQECIGCFKNNFYPLQNVKSGVAEWICYGEDIEAPACNGCKEMTILLNRKTDKYPSFFMKVKCPLFKNEELGFRMVANIKR